MGQVGHAMRWVGWLGLVLFFAAEVGGWGPDWLAVVGVAAFVLLGGVGLTLAWWSRRLSRERNGALG